MHTDDAAEFKSRHFDVLFRKRGNRQEFTTANSPQFNGVIEKAIAMIESTGNAASTQVKPMFLV